MAESFNGNRWGNSDWG